MAVLLSTGAGLGTGILLSPAQHHVAVEVGCLLLAVSAAQVYVSVTLPELVRPTPLAIHTAASTCTPPPPSFLADAPADPRRGSRDVQCAVGILRFQHVGYGHKS